MSDPRVKLGAGRMLSNKRAPFWAKAVLSLMPREVPDGTLSTEGTFACTEDELLLYEPAALARWAPEDVSTGLAHEANHIVRKHPARCKAMVARAIARGCKIDSARLRHLANCAADAELADDLIAMRYKMLPSDVTPTTLGCPNGWTAEAYFEHLVKAEESGSGPQLPDPGVRRGACGGCAGNPVPGEPAPGQGRSKAEVDRMRLQVANAVRHAAQTAGNVPGRLRVWAQAQFEPPPVSWEERLAKSLRVGLRYRAGAVDLRYARPSRRQAGVGWGPGAPRVPGLVAYTPRVAVVFDTSGSMSGSPVAIGVAEVERIVRAVGGDVRLIVCDAAVHADVSARGASDVQNALAGGGGTDMRPAFAAALEGKNAAHIIVCITDGFLFHKVPEPPPHVRTIWLLTSRHSRTPEPWGEVINMGAPA